MIIILLQLLQLPLPLLPVPLQQDVTVSSSSMMRLQTSKENSHWGSGHYCTQDGLSVRSHTREQPAG